MKSLRILMLIFVISNSLWSAQPVEKHRLPPITHYYSAAQFNSITNGAQHAPLLILFDQENNEPAESNNIALTSSLAYSLSNPHHFAPILVSGYLLKNLLIRTQTYEPSHFHATNQMSITLKTIMDRSLFVSLFWSIYDVPGSHFVLVVPKLINDLFGMTGKNLGLKKLPSLNHLIPQIVVSGPQKNNPYQPLISWLNKNKPTKNIPEKISSDALQKSLSYDITADLEKIFVNKLDDSTPIWDIFMDGHGDIKPAIIANLLPQDFNKMLTFFDRKIKTGIVYVYSCFAGGENRKLLETTQDGVQTNHNYIIILGSISNSIVLSLAEHLYQNIVNFFSLAGAIEDKGTSIDNLILQITQFSTTAGSYHGATGFPQIWFPGGYGFQTSQIVDQALTLGNVSLRTHKENNQPIDATHVLIVLVYPQVIDVSINIAPYNMQSIINKEWKNLAFIFENSFFSNISMQMQQTIIDILKAEKLLPDYLSQLPASALANNSSNPNYYLYPQFISMAPHAAQYWFSNITISSMQNNRQVAGGVLQFIRDAFFDPSKESEHTYFIETLTGMNDISLTLAASRLLANIKTKHPLEQVLKQHANKTITLKNVIADPYNPEISFQFDNTAWILEESNYTDDPTKQMRWNFKSVNSKDYETRFKARVEKLKHNGVTTSQKNISTILREKQRQILLKKAVELKKKQEEVDAAKKAATAPVVAPQPPVTAPQPKTISTAPTAPAPAPVATTKLPEAKPQAQTVPSQPQPAPIKQPVKLAPKIQPAPAKQPVKLQPKTVPVKPAPVKLTPTAKPAPAKPLTLKPKTVPAAAQPKAP